MPALILLVNVDKTELRQIEARLSAEGYLVMGTPSLRRASKLLNSVIPDLLIADITLGDLIGLQGLQLAVLSRRDRPNLPVIVTHASPDSDLENEAERRQITFVVKPLDNPDFLRKVKAAVGEPRSVESLIRRWPRKRASSIRARLADAPAQLVDVSYGGLRLELRDPGHSPAPVFDLGLPAADITLKVERVWQGRAREENAVWWGVKLLETDPTETERWREFVDSVADQDASA